MSTTAIVQRVFTQVPETAFHMGGINFLRPLAVGSDWFRIRIGVLCAINATSTVATGNFFYFGLSSSYGRGSGCLNTGQFLGAYIANNTSWTLGGTTNPYFQGGANVSIVRKYDQIIPYNVGASAQPFLAQVGAGQRLRRTPIYIDITRSTSNSNATVTVYGCSSTTVLFDYRPDHFFAGLDTWTTPVCNSQTMTTLATSAAIGVQELVGGYDTFDLFWSNVFKPLEVYAVGASMFLEKPLLYQGVPFTGGYENFESYGTGSNCAGLPPNAFLGTVLQSNAVSPWTSGTFIGYSNTPAAYFGNPNMFGGTVGSYPCESIRFYGTGTVMQDVTLNLGQLWTGNGTVLAV